MAYAELGDQDGHGMRRSSLHFLGVGKQPNARGGVGVLGIKYSIWLSKMTNQSMEKSIGNDTSNE